MVVPCYYTSQVILFRCPCSEGRGHLDLRPIIVQSLNTSD